MANNKNNSKNESVRIKENDFPLTKINFILIIVCGLMIVLGFVLMLGAPSTEKFNPDIFSTRRIVIGPAIAFLGYIFMAVAIMFNRRSKKDD